MTLHDIISDVVMRTLTLSHQFFSIWVGVTNISDNTTPITISYRPESTSFFQSLANLTVNSAQMLAAISDILRSMTHVVS